MILIVPPGGDPTLRLAAVPDGATVVDVGRRFVAELVRQATRGVLRTRSRSPGDRLMATAGTRALGDASRPRLHRLRGLGAVLGALHEPGNGVRLRLDDLEPADGSLESAADVLRAAAAPAPYDGALAGACADVPRGAAVRLVVEREQQVPAAVALARALRPRVRRLELTGRWATAHGPALAHLPPFAGVALVPAPRGMPWELADPFGPAPDDGLRWRERPADPIPAGPWAGRVGLRELVGGVVPVYDPEPGPPAGPGSAAAAGAAGAGPPPTTGRPDDPGRQPRLIVVGVCGAADRAVGRGGTELSWDRLASAVGAARDRGTTVVAELWLGAPGIPPEAAEEALGRLEDVVDRVIGLRRFDWPADWTAPSWASRPVTTADAGPELALRRPLLDPVPPSPERLAALAASLGRPLARAGRLAPGRVAGAYLPPPGPHPDSVRGLDPDVVVGRRSARADRALAVNLRTGACSYVSLRVADAIDRYRDGYTLREALRPLSPGAVRALREGGVLGQVPLREGRVPRGK
ncbi:hypothetical protein ACSNOK_00495 [Streptomyces sp. URMC 126]|uniref:hypothetical protein n=1 Tax=Streptomyces sp. URMC 126 TaxID=3423401 RepID=UPI003F1D9610